MKQYTIHLLTSPTPHINKLAMVSGYIYCPFTSFISFQDKNIDNSAVFENVKNFDGNPKYSIILDDSFEEIKIRDYNANWFDFNIVPVDDEKTKFERIKKEENDIFIEEESIFKNEEKEDLLSGWTTFEFENEEDKMVEWKIDKIIESNLNEKNIENSINFIIKDSIEFHEKTIPPKLHFAERNIKKVQLMRQT